MDILFDFLKVLIEFINFLSDDIINLFLAFGDELLKYCDDLVQVFSFFEIGPLQVRLQYLWEFF